VSDRREAVRTALAFGLPGVLGCTGLSWLLIAGARFPADLALLTALAGALPMVALGTLLVARSGGRPEPRPVPAEPPPPVDSPPAEGTPPGLARELRESREIQRALLPARLPSVAGYHLEVDYRPCGVLGGDFYDFLPMADGRLWPTLGDVSGKGPSGAIVMAMVQTLFRQLAPVASGPADLLSRVNEGFSGALGKGVFVTATVGLLDPARHRLSLAGAGHAPAILLDPERRSSREIPVPGLALGLVSGDRFAAALQEAALEVEPGAALLLFTDGATEVAADLVRDVGESRLRAAAAAAVLSGPEGVLDRLGRDLFSDTGSRDDTTLLLVARAPRAGRTGRFQRQPESVEIPGHGRERPTVPER